MEKGERALEKKRAKGTSPEAAREEERRQLLTKALSYVLPGKEAQRVSARLLEAMGSFDGVFAAPQEVLREIAGPEAADFVGLVIRISQTYLEERSWNLRRVYDTASAVELFRPKFLGKSTEAACLMLLDGRGRVVFNDVICEGSVSQVVLRLRQVLRLCIEYSAEDVLLAHNHPSGIAFPSQSDLAVTDRLITALETIGARLSDHIIFAEESYYSFQASGALDEQMELTLTAHTQEMEAVRGLWLRLQGESGESR